MDGVDIPEVSAPGERLADGVLINIEHTIEVTLDHSSYTAVSVVVLDETRNRIGCADLAPNRIVQGNIGGINMSYFSRGETLPSIQSPSLIRTELGTSTITFGVNNYRAGFPYVAHTHASPCLTEHPAQFQTRAGQFIEIDFGINSDGEQLTVFEAIPEILGAGAMSLVIKDCVAADGQYDYSGSCAGGRPRMVCVDLVPALSGGGIMSTLQPTDNIDTTLPETTSASDGPCDLPDLNHPGRCAGWQSIGYCEPGHRFNGYMIINCAFTCNACAISAQPGTDSPVPVPTTMPPTPAPSTRPSPSPSRPPSRSGSLTIGPAPSPSTAPTTRPSWAPSRAPTTTMPSWMPSRAPTTTMPSWMPSSAPTTTMPSWMPSRAPLVNQDPVDRNGTVKLSRAPSAASNPPSVSPSDHTGCAMDDQHTSSQCLSWRTDGYCSNESIWYSFMMQNCARTCLCEVDDGNRGLDDDDDDWSNSVTGDVSGGSSKSRHDHRFHNANPCMDVAMSRSGRKGGKGQLHYHPLSANSNTGRCCMPRLPPTDLVNWSLTAHRYQPGSERSTDSMLLLAMALVGIGVGLMATAGLLWRRSRRQMLDLLEMRCRDSADDYAIVHLLAAEETWATPPLQSLRTLHDSIWRLLPPAKPPIQIHRSEGTVLQRTPPRLSVRSHD